MNTTEFINWIRDTLNTDVSDLTPVQAKNKLIAIQAVLGTVKTVEKTSGEKSRDDSNKILEKYIKETGKQADDIWEEAKKKKDMFIPEVYLGGPGKMPYFVYRDTAVDQDLPNNFISPRTIYTGPTC